MSLADYRPMEQVAPSAPSGSIGLDRLPPQDIPAEMSALGAMLLSKDAIAEVVETAVEDDFYLPAHQTIYGLIRDLYTKGEPVDPLTVANALSRSGDLDRIGGAVYLHTLVEGVPTAAHAAGYAGIVRERSLLRKLVTAGSRITGWGYAGDGEVDSIVDRAQQEVFEVSNRRAAEDYLPLADLMDGAVTELESLAARGGQMVGVPTGITDLDKLTNGLHAGQLIIVAARPAIGKALALDTPLPAPTGWTTMGEVRVGDHVVDRLGRPTRVIAATDVLTGRDCFRVEFSDDSHVVADAEHEWPVLGGGTATTRTLAAADAEVALPASHPVRSPEASLPVDPYLIGVWLAATVGPVAEGAVLRCRAADWPVARLAELLGPQGPTALVARCLRGSIDQRRALLAGWSDSAGRVGAMGKLTLRSGPHLRTALRELLASLGLAPEPGQGQDEVSFRAQGVVFRDEELTLAHKRAMGGQEVGPRRIVRVVPVPSVPVRCIQVDNDERLYLAGPTMAPTHNSTLGLDIARAASIRNGLTSVLFSLEMGRNEIVMRLMSAEAKVALQNMRSGNLSDAEWQKIAMRQGDLHEAPLFIDDSPNMTMTEIRAKCRRLRQRNDLRLVIVDYMQLMQSGKKVESRQQEVSEFSRSMKLLAKELEVPVIAISQLNRGPEARSDKKPMLSDLRESGSLEQDADMVILIHRDDAYDKNSSRLGEADLIVAKHRNGPTDTIPVAFQGHYSRFADMAAE